MQFIRTRQVLEMIGVSRTTLWRMVQEGTFPQPIQVTGRNAHYVRQAVEAWMRGRAQAVPREPRIATPVVTRAPLRSGRHKLGLARQRAGSQG